VDAADDFAPASHVLDEKSQVEIRRSRLDPHSVLNRNTQPPTSSSLAWLILMATDVITISTRASSSEIDAANRRLGVSAWADWGRLSLLGVVLFLHFAGVSLNSSLRDLSKYVGTKGFAGNWREDGSCDRLKAPLYGGRKVASVPITVNR
jgi:hypothetical protein